MELKLRKLCKSENGLYTKIDLEQLKASRLIFQKAGLPSYKSQLYWRIEQTNNGSTEIRFYWLINERKPEIVRPADRLWVPDEVLKNDMRVAEITIINPIMDHQ